MKHLKQDALTQEAINERNIALLRENFPGAIEENIDGSFTVNANKLQMLIDPKNATIEENGYELNWVGKKEAYHTAFSKNTKILKPLKEDSKDFDTTGNILIKGDNLDALKILKNNYFEAIKMIYIDPPYNTTSENFVYRDDFTKSLEDTMEELGYDAENIDYIKNIQGARTHSGWLSFMYPRLLLARDLLKDDGVIFISIDDNEQANLKILCDEIFGEANFISNLVWEKRYGRSNDAKLMSSVLEYVLLYRKSPDVNNLREPRKEENDKDYTNPDNDPRGLWTSVSFVSQRTKGERPNCAYTISNPTTKNSFEHPTNAWKYNQEKYEQFLSEDRFYWGKNNDQEFPRIKRFLGELSEGMVPVNMWKHTDSGTTDQGTKEVIELIGKNIFPYPKPITLIQRMLSLGTSDNDIILDFFAGSGTSAHAIMDLNAKHTEKRKFILIQLPEPTMPKSEAKTAGYETIYEITAERLRRAGEKVKSDYRDKEGIDNLDIGFRVFEIVEDEKQAIYKKSLEEVSQSDLTLLTMPQMEDIDTVLYNLLVAEALPLSSQIRCLKENAFYIADNVAFIVGDIKLDEVSKLLAEHKKVEYITIYSPLVNDNEFSLEVGNELTRLGFSNDKLRFRG
jgi:adenine-specific DNA-methyltransferase